MDIPSVALSLGLRRSLSSLGITGKLVVKNGPFGRALRAALMHENVLELSSLDALKAWMVIESLMALLERFKTNNVLSMFSPGWALASCVSSRTRVH